MIIENIVDWNIKRNLLTFDPDNEQRLIDEEVKELKKALAENNEYETVDAYCDLIVVAVGALYKLGYNPERALRQTYYEISSRLGSINKSTGKWQKDPNQSPSTLYKANYELAKR